MVDRLVRLTDFFISERVVGAEARVRARMFIVLVLSSIFFISISLVHALVISVAPREIYSNVAVVFSIQSAFLVLARYLKDPEWACLFYLLMTAAFIAMEALLLVKSILHPGLQILPLVVIFGLLSIVNPYKRIFLLTATLLAGAVSVIFMPEPAMEAGASISQTNVLDSLFLGTLYKGILILFCMYWYVYFKRLSERELQENIRRRVRSAQLDEIANTLKTLVPEFHRPLMELEQCISARLAVGLSPGREDMMRLEDSIQQMIKVTQSVGWVYRAYRNETIGEVHSRYFKDQLEILLKGKAHQLAWDLKVHNPTRSCTLAGPMPLVILLILSLVDHVLNALKPSPGRLLEIELHCEATALVCLLRWRHGGEIFSLVQGEKERLAINMSSTDFRLELIGELVHSCKARLELIRDEDLDTISVRGEWIKAGLDQVFV